MGVLKRIAYAVAGPVLALAMPLTASAQGLIRDAEIEQTLRDYSDPLFTAAGLKASDVSHVGAVLRVTQRVPAGAAPHAVAPTSQVFHSPARRPSAPVGPQLLRWRSR